eukprot:XP_014064603.1 PREDICTED: meiotic nuclear division protein 1 homolog isoform X1 [Salmo salar]
MRVQKKGLRLEEKRTRMMEIFFGTKEVFQLKDTEKIAPKTKGITPMSVKEVLQSLVDDNMVDCERVGTSNYYWAFPSKALHARKRRLEELDKQHTEEKQRKMSLQQAVDKSKVGREETESPMSQLKRQCPDGQITSLPSNRGPRGSLVSMTDASIKPGYLKTLITWTDCTICNFY